MRDRERIFELRKNMIDDWKYRALPWREICYKYRVSKRWFYKLRMRFMLQGYEGLRDRVRKNDNRHWDFSLRYMALATLLGGAWEKKAQEEYDREAHHHIQESSAPIFIDHSSNRLGF